VTPFWKSVRELAAMRKFIPRERRAMSAVREVFRLGAPDPADTLHEALRALVDVLDRQGGYMTSEDQAALWRARRLVR
jgi:hypothetical protein